MTSNQVLDSAAPDASAAAAPALEAHGITVRYGGVTAVDDVSLQLCRHEITGLIGPNGAGKTTLIEVLSGFVVPRHGHVQLGSRKIDRLSPHRRARRGLGRVFQHLELFGELTVRENLAVAYQWGVRERRITPEAAAEALGLTPELDRRTVELSQGRRKLVALARAAVPGPEVILMDEPAAGLGPADTEAVAAYIRSLTDAGTSILLVDHDMSFVLPTCDRIVVLNFGAVIATGTPEEIRRNPDVLAAYLGEP